MAFAIPDHLPRKSIPPQDVSTQILSKIADTTTKTLTADLASSWVAELESTIHITKVSAGVKYRYLSITCDILRSEFMTKSTLRCRRSSASSSNPSRRRRGCMTCSPMLTACPQRSRTPKYAPFCFEPHQQSLKLKS